MEILFEPTKHITRKGTSSLRQKLLYSTNMPRLGNKKRNKFGFYLATMTYYKLLKTRVVDFSCNDNRYFALSICESNKIAEEAYENVKEWVDDSAESSSLFSDSSSCTCRML